MLFASPKSSQLLFLRILIFLKLLGYANLNLRFFTQIKSIHAQVVCKLKFANNLGIGIFRVYISVSNIYKPLSREREIWKKN